MVSLQTLDNAAQVPYPYSFSLHPGVYSHLRDVVLCPEEREPVIPGVIFSQTIPQGWGTPLKKLQGCLSYLLGGKICELVPLRVIKPNVTPARVVAVPFRGL